MEKELLNSEKQILLVDLCARLPYGVKVSCLGDFNHDWYNLELVDIKDNEVYISTCEPYYSNKYTDIESIRPYLFPLSSMNLDQRVEYSRTLVIFDKSHCSQTHETYDWLNKNHFDFRGLIEKGLALDATGLNIY